VRSRIDLDGIPLTDPTNPYMTLAVFRFRTEEGLVLLIPESAETLVRWAHVEQAAIDLVAGRVELSLRPDFVAGQSWLRGARQLTGEWLDRQVLSAKSLGLS
jgi:hypothetical protein